MSRYLPVLMRSEAGEFASMSLLSWLWGGAGSLVLLYVLIVGGKSHAMRVWSNPCQVCAFWAKSFHVKSFRACSQPCWIVRLTRALHSVSDAVQRAYERRPVWMQVLPAASSPASSAACPTTQAPGR